MFWVGTCIEVFINIEYHFLSFFSIQTFLKQMPSKCFQVVNTDYINASLLTVSAVDRSYILTQGPLQVVLFNQEK